MTFRQRRQKLQREAQLLTAELQLLRKQNSRLKEENERLRDEFAGLANGNHTIAKKQSDSRKAVPELSNTWSAVG